MAKCHLGQIPFVERCVLYLYCESSGWVSNYKIFMSTIGQSENQSHEAARSASSTVPIAVGLLGGILLGAVIYWFTSWKGIWQFVAVGALLGGAFGFFWRRIHNVWERFRSEDWEVTEIEIETPAQKWKLVNSGSQRRVAWSLFVETATRIGTQLISDSEGDDGVMLRSLYDLFQITRSSISEIEPTRPLPSREQGTDTVETYALAMLNHDLRPFLSKWHPQWDTWQKANPDKLCADWEGHQLFRSELKLLQEKIRVRAHGLGEIAGVPQVERFLHTTSHSE